MKKLLTILVALLPVALIAQARLVLNNGGYMVMQNNIYLVIDNPNSNAITQLGSGGNIVSESENNKIRWNIGTNTGAYTIPFTDNVGSGATYGNNAQTVDAGNKIPFTFTITAAGSGASGYIDFSTYDGASWDNNTYRPSMVTHMGQMIAPNVVNHSDYAIDRFWLVNAQGYSTKPAGTLTFTYIDNEWSAAGNVLAEANLGAQRFNDGAGLWGDMWAIVSSLNTASNTLVTPTIAASDMFTAWTLSDINDPLPVELVLFNADCQNDGTVKLSWVTASEINNDYFDVQKSFDASDFFSIGTVAGNGNSNTMQYYEFIDKESGTAYYRLKQVDFDGKYDISDVAVASCKTDNLEILAFDNYSGFTVKVMANFSDKVTVDVVDARGRLIQSQSVNINEGLNQFELNQAISTGIYFIRFNGEKINESLKVFKR
jgi:hypothetical protein